jgi:hypothetical protein
MFTIDGRISIAISGRMMRRTVCAVVSPTSFQAFNRFILQATFALGPHRPHPF